MGGYDPRLPIMEDADLCIKLHMMRPAGAPPGTRGRVVQLLRHRATTSGRRVAGWGNARATFVHFFVALAWYRGASPERMHELYNSMYGDAAR